MVANTLVDDMARDITAVDGIVGVTLGGSRARGDALPSSDVDLGIYYDGSPDVAGLAQVATRWAGREIEVVAPGGWGDWVSGGAWAEIGGEPVDWLLRDVARVTEQWTRARSGKFAFHTQFGHPLGFLDVSYVGELALGIVLADTHDALSRLREPMTTYPPKLRSAMSSVLFESDFLIRVSRKSVHRIDVAYVDLCLTRAVLLAGHALYAHNAMWVTTEKGLIPGVGRLAVAPTRFPERCAQILSATGPSADALLSAIGDAEQLIADTRSAMGIEGGPMFR